MKSNKMALLVVYTLAGLIAASAPLRAQQLQTGAKTILSGTVPAWLGRARQVGPADENGRVVIEAYLGWRNQSKLEQLIQEQATPGNPRYGQFLTPEQFHAAFSPRSQDVALVQRTLSELGFNVRHTPASGLFVEASGSVGQIKQVFGVSQNLYSYRGKILRAHAEEPSVPAQLSGLVTYIDGLDDVRPLMKPALARPLQATGPSLTTTGGITPPDGHLSLYPCSNYWGDHQALLESPSPFPYGSTLPWWICGYTPQQVRAAYGADQVPETGRNVRVAITDLYSSSTLQADVNRYSRNHGLPPLTVENFSQILQPGVNHVPAGDPCGSANWLLEQTVDVTAVHSMAPNASIIFIGGSCDQVDVVDAGVAEEPLYAVIDQKLADIVTNSWAYSGEGDVSTARLAADIFQHLQAAAEGITLLFASGDSGDFPAGSGNWPGTSPYATSVGGTSLLLRNASGEKAEYGWATYLATLYGVTVVNEKATKVKDQESGGFGFFGGSGGGPSLIIPEPFYQLDVVPNRLATRTHTADGTLVPLNGSYRVTPDVAMVADPGTGFLEGETLLISAPPVDPGCTKLSETTEYCENAIGGTSVASPLFAGVLALVNERRFSQGLSAVGFVNPALYALPVGGKGSNTPILDVNAPSEPLGVLIYFSGNTASFATLDSYPSSNGSIVENVDISLRSVTGYDNVTGLGTPWVPALMRTLGGPGE